MDDRPADNLSNQSTPPSIPDSGQEPSTPQPATTPSDIKTDPPTISGIDTPPISTPQPEPTPSEPAEQVKETPPPPPSPPPQPQEPPTQPASPPEPVEGPSPPPGTPPPKTEPESFSVSEKKKGSPVIVAGALIILLMAATLPAGISLVQTQTQLSSRAKEEAVLPSPTPKPPKTRTTYNPLTVEDQQQEWVQDIKPQNVGTQTISSGTVRITFTTNTAYPSSIIYSPDEDWNYLTMRQEGDVGDEWKQRYHYENEKEADPKTRDEPTTEHEYVLKNLTPGQKYYYAIRIENPEHKDIYEFGLEQPENHYTFIVK